MNHLIYPNSGVDLIEESRASELAFEDQPNLFKYATSELSQDAFLSWLFEHVRFKTKDIVYTVAKQLLELIFEKQRLLNPQFVMSDLLDYSIKIEQQVHNIDILLTFQSNDQSEKIYVIIEDKTNSGESRENQPEYYANVLKVKDKRAVVIPVLFKTGYVSEEKQQHYKTREIVFIGYEDIYQLFSSHTQEITENVILHSWWVNFCNKFYKPIEEARSFALIPTMNLFDINERVKDQQFPEVMIFQKITDELFHGLAGGFSTKRYSVQGKGHIDWHFELTKPQWANPEKNIAVSLYFIWDTYDFSFVIKTSPFRYKPLKKLTNSEKKEYTEMQEIIKAELKAMKQIKWKMTNFYLQIAQMNNIHTMNLEELKKKIEEDTILIAREIDRIMG